MNWVKAMQISIREIRPDDAEAATRLAELLGYPVQIDVIRERIETLRSDHVVYVACVDDRVGGWIDVSICHHLVSGAFGEIGGMVVATEYQSQGVGRQLIAEAEQWVRERGVTKMVVRSRTTRERAHRFYLREGYSKTKTSEVFSKDL